MKVRAFFPLAFLVAVVIFSVGLRAGEVSDCRGWNAGFGFAVGQNDDKKATFEFTLRPGYRFNSRWETGGYLQYTRGNFASESNAWGGGIYGEYTVVQSKGFRLFIDAKASVNTITTSYYYDPLFSKGPDMDYYEVGFVPGIAYRFRDCPFELKLRYLYFGYVHSDCWYKDTPGCFGGKSFIFDVGFRRAELSLVYNF